MKHIRNKTPLAMAAAAVLLLAGCTKSDSEVSANPQSAGTIAPTANVQVITQTKAAVEGNAFAANTANVFRLTAFSGASAPTTDWSAPYFSDIQVNSGAASALTLATAKYYPVGGDKLYFYAYAPAATTLTAGTSSAAPVANYTITGQEDIMAAQETTGIAKASTGVQTQPNLAFTHKLMQVRFKIVKDASFEAGKKVTKILVEEVKTSAKLDIATGALTFDGAADKTLSLPIIAGTKDEITTNGTEMNGCVMTEPVGTGGAITLKVTADGVVYDNINVSLSGDGHGEAGTSHLVTLTFKRSGITPSVTITDWATPVDKDIDIEGEGLKDLPVVGDLRDGGIVYEVTDATKYKVFSLDQGTYLAWAAKDTYVIGSGGQSDTDGKANVAAMKAYSTDNTGNTDATKKTTGVFATDFPAAEFCDRKNTGGVTGWYLPATEELSALYQAYKAHKDVLDKAITDNSGTAMASGYFWSSTEYSLNASSGAWCVGFSNGGTINGGKDGNISVRCVRDITPPPAIGDAKDGGIVYWVDPADPTSYKVFSLDQGTDLAWAASTAYEIGVDGQSDTDGKANVAAIKAYFAANEATVGNDFSAAFPAAEFCDAKNTDGVTGWYLPATEELSALYQAYKAHKDVLDKAITDNSGTAMASGNFWSSTELSSYTGFAWYVNFSSGDPNSYVKLNDGYVRCVRDL